MNKIHTGLELEGFINSIISKYKAKIDIEVEGSDLNFEINGDLLKVASELNHPLSHIRRKDWVEFTIYNQNQQSYKFNINSENKGLEVKIKELTNNKQLFAWNSKKEEVQSQIQIGNNIKITLDVPLNDVQEVVNTYF